MARVFTRSRLKLDTETTTFKNLKYNAMAYHKLFILNVILVIGLLTRELCHGTGVQEQRDPDDPNAGGDSPKAGGEPNF